MNILLDEFKKTGLDINSLKLFADEFDSKTHIKEVGTEFLTALYCYRQKILGTRIINSCMVVYDDSLFPLDDGTLATPETADIQSEMTEKNEKLLRGLKHKMLITFSDDSTINMNDCYFLSPLSFKSLALKTSVKQKLFGEGISSAIFLCEGLSDMDTVSILYRQEDKYKKIFAFTGSNYPRTALKTVSEIAESLSDMFTFQSWEVTNGYSKTRLSKGKFVAEIATSDVLKFADSIRIYLHDKNDFLLKEYSIKDFLSNPEKIKEDIEKTLNIADDRLFGITNDKASKMLEKAVGKKKAVLALPYIEKSDSAAKALIELFDILELRDYQVELYTKIFTEVF